MLKVAVQKVQNSYDAEVVLYNIGLGLVKAITLRLFEKLKYGIWVKISIKRTLILSYIVSVIILCLSNLTELHYYFITFEVLQISFGHNPNVTALQSSKEVNPWLPNFLIDILFRFHHLRRNKKCEKSTMVELNQDLVRPSILTLSLAEKTISLSFSLKEFY